MSNTARILPLSPGVFAKAVLEEGGLAKFIAEHGAAATLDAIEATRDMRIPTHDWSKRSSIGALALGQADVVERQLLGPGGDARRFVRVVAAMPQESTRAQSLILYTEPLVKAGLGDAVIHILRGLSHEAQADVLAPLDGPATALVRGGKGREVLGVLRNLGERNLILGGSALRAAFEQNNLGGVAARIAGAKSPAKAAANDTGSGVRAAGNTDAVDPTPTERSSRPAPTLLPADPTVTPIPPSAPRPELASEIRNKIPTPPSAAGPSSRVAAGGWADSGIESGPQSASRSEVESGEPSSSLREAARRLFRKFIGVPEKQALPRPSIPAPVTTPAVGSRRGPR